MADLLECLLQIKGLRETADRVARLFSTADRSRWTVTGGGPPAVELLSQLADLEMLYGAWLRAMVASDAPSLPAFDDATVSALARFREWTPDGALEHFLGRRSDNLELLDRCSAEDLARIGHHPVRRALTVADVVASMLASDFERLAGIRRALDL